MKTLEVIPDPVSLIESMRAVGYTVEAAIADLIDNSISASADLIEVKYDASDTPFVAVLDNGRGMTEDELTNAMRHGSSNPTTSRDASDLGRFGLGLKTASLSQCRKLTVVSKKAGTISARCWDIDVVRLQRRWLVVVPSEVDMKTLPMFSCLQSFETGTLVVWHNLDRLIAGARNQQSEMTTKLASLFDHLALVFHRFSRKEDGHNAVIIKVNGLLVPSLDPFLKENSFRQPLEGQVIRHKKGDVVVTPFILPPVSHLTLDEIERAGGKEGLRGTQGFYVYRNRRLVVWGTWFRLVPKDEFYKLTRIQVDIPNTFDELWALDIKKSVAYPPDSIRNRLKELIPHFVSTSRRTITYPGRKQSSKEFVPLWQIIEPKHGSFRYELNINHPSIIAFSQRLGEDERKHFQTFLNFLGNTLPIESIYASGCSDQRQKDDLEVFKELVNASRTLLEITGLEVEQILKIDPIVCYPQHHDHLLEELMHE